MCWTWVLAVRALIPHLRPISPLLSPSATAPRTCSSRTVRPSGGGTSRCSTTTPAPLRAVSTARTSEPSTRCSVALGFASEHDLLDWESLRGQVDDNLIILMREGETLTGVDIGRADVFRGAMWDTWTTFMDDYDVLVSPTLCSATFPLDRFAPEWLEGASLREQLLDWLLTYPYNMLNSPAITVPAGFTDDGRPVGLQIAARHHQDALVLRVAANLEQARPWAARRPAL
jgi:Asp-tRNA(Asn)/Glu-tRNA(Gln) amidotransferase A subunit family amidase